MEILYCSLGFHASIGTCQSCSKELTTYDNHCICKNNHKTCNDCYMDVVFEVALDGGNQKEIHVLCTTCGDILARQLRQKYLENTSLSTLMILICG